MNKERTWLIYCATSKTSGKSYVGQTFNLEKRKTDHLKNRKKKYISAFQLAIDKYGADDFIWVVLEENLSIDEANDSECFFIEYLNTLTPNGYNLRAGGRNALPSENTKEIIREKLKIVDSFVGKKGPAHPNWGRKYSPERCKKLSDSHAGEKSSSAKITKEKVIDLYMEVLSGSSPESLTSKYGIKRSAIYNIVRRKCWKNATINLPIIDLSSRVDGENDPHSSISEATALAIINEVFDLKLKIRNFNKVLADKYHTTCGVICGIATGRTWKHLPR